MIESFFLVTALAGCSQPDDGQARLRFWADRLKVRSWGKVTVEDYVGSTKFSDETPTLMLLMSSALATVHEHVKRALDAQRFSMTGDEWSSQGANEYRVVNIRELHDGAKVYLPGVERSLTVTRPTVQLTLQVSLSSQALQ